MPAAIELALGASLRPQIIAETAAEIIAETAAEISGSLAL